ncbi:MAG: glycosyltransferase family 39 protein [Phycisphaerales bacterium]|nr:glycosyltransferase family 39 protein [Phycisphaerales bacterium]
MDQPTTNNRHPAPWWFTIADKPFAPLALLTLVLALTLLWQYLSPFTLIEDEAHYWEWSRRLDWSYYSKGPGVALLIRASTTILGNSEFAIRAPAALSVFLGASACVLTARELFKDRIITFTAAVLYLGVPGFAFSSMLMTIDAPYLACWSFASFFAVRALLRGRSRDWFSFGITLAIGFLFKYTILLLLPGVLLAILLTRNKRPRINPSACLLGSSLVLLGLVPVLVWNSNHDWATFRHLLGHLGMHGGDTENTLAGPSEPFSILWPLEFLALFLLVGGGPLFLGLFAWRNTKLHAPQQHHTAATTLVALALPVALFYFLVSFKAQTEGNWPMSAFVSLVPLGAWAVKDAIARNDRPVRSAWGAAIVSILLVFAFFPLANFLSTRRIIGPYIPIHRITGMREHAQAAQHALDQLRQETGLEPIIITDHYGRASLLAYYLDGHPTVYCASALVGGRKTQYDLWPSTDLANPSLLIQLRGRPALLFGGPERTWSTAFDNLTNIGPLPAEPKSHQTTYTGLRFTDFSSWRPAQPGEHTP